MIKLVVTDMDGCLLDPAEGRACICDQSHIENVSFFTTEQNTQVI